MPCVCVLLLLPTNGGFTWSASTEALVLTLKCKGLKGWMPSSKMLYVPFATCRGSNAEELTRLLLAIKPKKPSTTSTLSNKLS